MQPAAGAVHRRGEQHRHQRDRGDPEAGPDHDRLPVAPVVDAHDDRHERQADEDPGRLLEQEEVGLLPFSVAMTAEALYTMTMLVHTSSSVAVKSNLSDLSFRAILRCLKVPGTATDK